MATEQEVYRYLLQIEGDEKLKTAAAAASLAEQKFRALYDQFGAGDARTRAAAASLVDLTTKLEAGKAANRDLGMAALQASRGFEDLQYGVAGVLNNIPGLVAALGGPAGLAGVISAAAVAGKILYDHWNDLAALFGQGHTKTQAEQMEDLGKKTAKTADETARLAKYEQDRKNLADQRAPTEAQAGFTRGVNEAIREAPESAIRDALGKIHGDAIRNSIDQTVLDELETARDYVAASKTRGSEVDPGYAKGRLAKAQAAVDTAFNEGLDKQQAALAADPAALQAFLKRAQEKNLLSGKQVAGLREAARSPEEKASEEYYRKQDEENASKSAEFQEGRRQADEAEEKASEEYYRKQDAESASAKAAYDEKNRQADEDRARERRPKAVKDANEQAPGLDDLIRARLVAAGNSTGGAMQLGKELTGRFGAQTAMDLVNGQRDDAQKELTRRFLDGPENKHRSSQVIDSAGLADSIQQAVGGQDVQKQQLDELKRVNQLLGSYLSRGAANAGPILRR